jgi:hypothetical protein
MPNPVIVAVPPAMKVTATSGRLPLHDSFRLTLGARSSTVGSTSSQSRARASRLQSTVYVG